MAISYGKVYQLFLSQINEYSFLQYNDEDLADVLFPFLVIAISEFDNCKVDLSLRNDFSSEFIGDLSDKELLILAKLMIVAFLKPKVLTSENYQQVMTDNEFRIYSQANHIDKLILVYQKFYNEAHRDKTNYSFKNSISNLKNGKK